VITWEVKPTSEPGVSEIAVIDPIPLSDAVRDRMFQPWEPEYRCDADGTEGPMRALEQEVQWALGALGLRIRAAHHYMNPNRDGSVRDYHRDSCGPTVLGVLVGSTGGAGTEFPCFVTEPNRLYLTIGDPKHRAPLEEKPRLLLRWRVDVPSECVSILP